MPTLRWLTRDEDVKAADNVPYRLLEEVPELSYGDRDTGNMLIQGDNLDALKALLPYYAGQVKCIYIDPPYNIDAAVGDAYDDNLAHAQWLGILTPRLHLLREFLCDGGLFIASIDDKEGAYLTVLCDEVFGRKNRINVVSVKMSEASGVKMSHADKRLPKLKEFLLIYSVGNRPNLQVDKLPPQDWNEEYKTLLVGLTDDEIAQLKKIIGQEEITEECVEVANRLLEQSELESLSKYFKKHGINEEAATSWKFANAHKIVQAVGSSSVFELAKKSEKSGGAISAAKSPTGLLYLFKSEFNTTAKQPRVQIIFADDNLETHPGDFWPDIKTTGGVGQEGGVLFPNSKKPEALIQRVIKMNTQPTDLVMDSFLGSGTTAAVAKKLGRKFIGVEMNAKTAKKARLRLKNVVDGEQSGISKAVNWQGGGGFRFFRLGPSIFDETGQIRPDIEFPTLAAHIWFYEVGLPWDKPASPSPVLGTHDGMAYALLYNGILGDKRANGGNVLTRQTLGIIRDAMDDPALPLVVYGERSALSENSLKRENISFKQTPYDVKAQR